MAGFSEVRHFWKSTLVLGDFLRLVGIESAEMDEVHGLPVHAELPVPGGHVTLVKVPVGDVVAGLATDSDAIKQTWGEVHPALIDEEAAVQRHHTFVIQLFAPPGEQLRG